MPVTIAEDRMYAHSFSGSARLMDRNLRATTVADAEQTAMQRACSRNAIMDCAQALA